MITGQKQVRNKSETGQVRNSQILAKYTLGPHSFPKNNENNGGGGGNSRRKFQ